MLETHRCIYRSFIVSLHYLKTNTNNVSSLKQQKRFLAEFSIVLLKFVDPICVYVNLEYFSSSILMKTKNKSVIKFILNRLKR